MPFKIKINAIRDLPISDGGIDLWETAENQRGQIIGYYGDRVLKDYELSVYENLFSEHARSEKAFYRTKKHPERAKSVPELWKMKKTMPDNILIKVTGEGFPYEEIARAYMEDIRTRYMEYAEVLYAGIIEKMDHGMIQVRIIWYAKDRYGFIAPGRSKAFSDIFAFDKEDRNKRYNEDTAYISAELRAFMRICKQHSLEIDGTKEQYTGAALLDIKKKENEEKDERERMILEMTRLSHKNQRYAAFLHELIEENPEIAEKFEEFNHTFKQKYEYKEVIW